MSSPGNGIDSCDPCRVAVRELGYQVDAVTASMTALCKSIDLNTRLQTAQMQAQNDLMRELIKANTSPQRNSSRLNTALIVVLLAFVAMSFAREHGASALNDAIDHLRGQGAPGHPLTHN